jgi:hypothetical protein
MRPLEFVWGQFAVLVDLLGYWADRRNKARVLRSGVQHGLDEVCIQPSLLRDG